MPERQGAPAPDAGVSAGVGADAGAGADAGVGVRVGATAAAGFVAAAVHAGIRRKQLDLGVLAADRAVPAAAVFTTNRVQAAPILWCKEALAASGGRARAVVVNSGNANACTGAAGEAAARATAETAARLLGEPPEHVLVASTGVIGQPLPVDRLLAALPSAVAGLAPAGGLALAEAILTTDTVTKLATRTVETSGGTYTVGGVAKGSGMVHPDMATTLAFVTTDAEVEPERLQAALRAAADVTFNRITVDGDTSTNDMIAVLAGGASRVRVDAAAHGAFEAALTAVLRELAIAVVRDGEGARRLVTVQVTGGRTETEALQVARAIAGSLLVKTAIHGADANWGRIVAAAGRSGVAIAPERLRVELSGLPVLLPGYVSNFSEDEARAILLRDEVVIGVDLGQGGAEATTWTCDLSADYVAINASYRT